jgi:hypothetical protein
MSLISMECKITYVDPWRYLTLSPRSHNHRPVTYGPSDYSEDFGVVDAALRTDPKITSVDGKLIGPSVSGNWKLEDIWDTGFLDKYQHSFAALSVE